jgi:hypothetical protein
MSRSRKQLKSQRKQRKQRKQKNKTQKRHSRRHRKYSGGGRLPVISAKSMKNPFIVLGLMPENATDINAFKKAYRVRALQFSQDKNPDELPLANKLMVALNAFNEQIRGVNGDIITENWKGNEEFVNEANASKAIRPVPKSGEFMDQFQQPGGLALVLTDEEQAFVDNEDVNNMPAEQINEMIRTVYRAPDPYSMQTSLTDLKPSALKPMMELAGIKNVNSYTDKGDMIRALNAKGIHYANK